MTLEKAIEHCKSVACEASKCGMEHMQLAEWLEELKQRRAQDQQAADLERIKNDAELIANTIMMGVQSTRYHTCVYDTGRNDFNHSHLVQAARKGVELGLKARMEGCTKSENE